MPVTSEHSQYKQNKPKWKKSRDCVEGSGAVKGASTVYLPPLTKQTDAQYDAYLRRALFYGATGRTVQALMGAIFRKDFTVEYPEQLQYQLETISLDGKDLATFARDVVMEVLSIGRVGILTDVVGQGVDTRPYLAVYTGENVINWREVIVNADKLLTMTVLHETYEERDENDHFLYNEKDQYRVLQLTSDGNSTRYVQDVWRKGTTDWSMVPELHVEPVRIGQPLTTIPFEYINSYDLTPEPDKPPLLDLVEVNLSHYRTSADLEHGAHYTALPTAWVAGFPKSSELTIGSSVAWVTEEVNAKAGFLEYTGQGLGALRDMKKDKEQLMAVLGARLLEDQKKAAEAAETLRIRAASESGSLTAITKNISSGIENSLKRLAWWSGASDQQVEEIRFELNTDFVDSRLSPQEQAELMKMLQGGGISQDTFLYNLKRGEILPDERSIEDEKALLDVSGTDEFDMSNITPLKREFELERDDNGNLQKFKEV